MRILIKEHNKTKLSLWLPSGLLVLKTLLMFVTYEGKKVSPQQRKIILEQVKILRKIHHPLVMIDIEQKNGDKVFIKI